MGNAYSYAKHLLRALVLSDKSINMKVWRCQAFFMFFRKRIDTIQNVRYYMFENRIDVIQN